MDESGSALGRRCVCGVKSKSGHVSLGAIGAFRRGNAKCGEKQEQSGDLLEKTSQVGLKAPLFSRARVSCFSFFLFTSSPVCRKVLYMWCLWVNIKVIFASPSPSLGVKLRMGFRGVEFLMICRARSEVKEP